MCPPANDRKSLPVVDEVFKHSPDEVRLIGIKCSECGAVAFPKTVIRHKPGCQESKVEQFLLNKRGILRTYTIQHYQPPSIFQAPQPFQPYVIASVEVPEGIEIAGILTGCEHEAITIGMEVEVTTYKLNADEKGNDVITYAFRPV